MAVKDGLPATDFSRMNREYIRNVAEGETVPDGLPATDFSRMNREYIRAVVEEAGGGGGDITVEPLSVTENGTYTADEGKAYSPVTVDVAGGGGGGDLSTATVTIINSTIHGFECKMPIIFEEDDFQALVINGYIDTGESEWLIPMYKNMAIIIVLDTISSVSTTGGVEFNSDENWLIVTGDGTVTISV